MMYVQQYTRNILRHVRFLHEEDSNDVLHPEMGAAWTKETTQKTTTLKFSASVQYAVFTLLKFVSLVSSGIYGCVFSTC
jgi:hypothetical protein